MTTPKTKLTKEPQQIVYFDGQFVPFDQAQVSVATHALHYATAVFEGIRGNWNGDTAEMNIFRLPEHYERLLKGAETIYIKVKESVADLCKITAELVKRCGYREDIYIRPLAFKGEPMMAKLQLNNLRDSLAIIALPFGNYLEEKPLKCVTSKWRRPPANSMPTGTKLAGIYTTSVLAKTEALLAGYDEAILLNSDGNVCEGSGENIFAFGDGVLTTPPVTDDCLGGITRATVMELAKSRFGVECREAHLTLDDLYNSEEVFFSGTAAHISAVGEIDGRQINSSKPGPVTTKLSGLYRSIIKGAEEAYLHWNTRVKV